MKIKLMALLAASAALFSCTSSDFVEKEVSEVMKGMTLEEKVGQMVQLNVTVVADGEGNVTPEGGSDDKKIQDRLHSEYGGG